jgi:NodT family efflux transporter outer membrane factor (OMF) lipoprotein
MSELATRAAALACAMVVAACAAVGPDYVPPKNPMSTSYSRVDPTRADAGDAEAGQRIAVGAVPEQWWLAFASPALDALVEQALAGSPTMESAEATLAQAREGIAAARGGLFPQVTLGASAGRSNQSEAGTAGVVNSSSIGPSLAYSVDAFGATSRRIEQAQALADLQQAQWLATRLTLTGGTVTQAIALASATEQMRAVQDIIAADQRNLELVQLSQAAGKSAGLDVLTAESQLASDRALLPPLQQQASAARHALAVLTGRSPAEGSAPRFDFSILVLPGDLPLALPSELVHRRPDIQAAEAQLHASSAAIGIAAAALYPSVTLNASFTSAAAGSGALFTHSSGLWGLAADLLAPVFDGGTLKAQRAAATDAYAAELGSYRQTVLLAFGQVADVLHALQHDGALLAAQRKALDAAQTTLDLTQQSYQAGQASFLQIIEAQRLFQQARLGYVRAQAQRYADSAQFFIATATGAGGGGGGGHPGRPARRGQQPVVEHRPGDRGAAGIWSTVRAVDVVPGDVVKLSLGAAVPADARIANDDVLLDQSMLTGESVPVEPATGCRPMPARWYGTARPWPKSPPPVRTRSRPHRGTGARRPCRELAAEGRAGRRAQSGDLQRRRHRGDPASGFTYLDRAKVRQRTDCAATRTDASDVPCPRLSAARQRR